ncbi:MAG: dihydrodipicolinate synthase family protein [Armatimonadota bacterium]
MIAPTDLRGIIGALGTTLTKRERVHEEGMRRLVRRALDAGCAGGFVLGTMCEGPYLRDPQKRRAVRRHM